MDWYLGRVGSLVLIPAPDDPADMSPQVQGGVVQSLLGAVTVDRTATPRTWKLSWAHLAEDHLTYLEAVGFGLVAGPLRLVDPMRRNRLAQQIASGGSQRRATDGFAQSGGATPTWVAVPDPPASVPVRGAISWQRSTTAAAILTTAGATYRVPVAAGEQVRVSLWARGAAIQASAAIDAWNAAESASRTIGTAATLNTTTWTQLSVAYTVPSDRISVTPTLNVASGQAASTLQATGWMVSLASEPAAWALGGGAPVVTASELGQSVSLFAAPRHTWSMTLREAMV